MWISGKARAPGDQNTIDTDVARSGLTPIQTDYYSDDWICVLDLDDPGAAWATFTTRNSFIYTHTRHIIKVFSSPRLVIIVLYNH